ncbi:MAG: TRAP transporter large permease subunit [Desulfovibrionaceae bacterium]|nr:TRAP transporter large permease subunit [Desulfovibrionaceae bacterium]
MTDSTTLGQGDLPKQDGSLARLAFLLDRLCSKANWLAYIAVAIMPVLICADVVGRIVGTGVPGALELQQNLLVLATYGIMGWLQSRDQHMSIDFVYKHMKGGGKAWADVFVISMTLVILCVLSWESVHIFMTKIGTLSLELYLPLELYYWMPIFGLALTLIVVALQTVRHITGALRDGHALSVVLALMLTAALVYLPFWYRESDYEVSNLVLGGIAFLLLFFFLFMKMPIGWTMCTIGAMGSIAIYRTVNAALAVVGSTPYSATASYSLVALPLFVLMGCLILYSGISVDLFNSANKWIGHLPGGMGMAGVAGCTGFAAVCGDSLATAVTMGSVSLPEMQNLKYDPALATGSLAAGGTLGILIPPSAGFIIYGIVTEVSIGRLFLAGLMPGLLLAGMFMTYIYITAVRHPEMAPRGPRYSLSEKVRSSLGLLPILALFVLVLGCIVKGICSPTEGGAVGVAGAFFYALARRKLTKENLLASLDETAILTGRIMLIMVGVGMLSFFFAQSRLPFLLADFIAGLEFNKFVIFGIIVVIYVILGCMMNVIPMLMLTLPSIFPTVLAMGFDPVWFGVVSVMIMEMGQITPPVGVVVFALSGVAKGIPMETIFRGIVPFVAIMIVGVILVTVFPGIATWLPYSIMGPELM